MSPRDFAKSLAFPITDILKLYAKGRIQPGDLFVKDTKTRGRGVFAGRDFGAGECLEICPVLIIPAKDAEWYVDTALDGFWYEDELTGDSAIALGFGSLYNHSYKPNAWYKLHYKEKTLSFWAARKIRKGREVRINYNPVSNDQAKIWFKVDEATAKERTPDKSVHLGKISTVDTLAWCDVDLGGDEELRYTLNPQKVTCRRCRSRMRGLRDLLDGDW